MGVALRFRLSLVNRFTYRNSIDTCTTIYDRRFDLTAIEEAQILAPQHFRALPCLDNTSIDKFHDLCAYCGVLHVIL